MQRYIGFKEINAKPMTRLEYNKFRGWELPSNENGADKGFLVEYVDGGQANTPEFKGYVSWSPEDVFYRAYQLRENGMPFGEAVDLLKRGYRVARQGWNGKGMYLSYKAGYPNGVPANEAHAKAHGCQVGDIIKYAPYIEMKTADNVFVPWLASQSDVLSDDWVIVDIEEEETK